MRRKNLLASRVCCCLAVLLLGWLSGCSNLQEQDTPFADLTVAGPAASASGTEPVPYRLHEGDTLEIRLYTSPEPANGNEEDKKPVSRFILGPGQTMAVKFVQAPELNETQVVRPDGTISLPYLGQYSVRGKTIPEVETELKTFYSRELKNPDLYITIPRLNSILDELDDHRFQVTVRPDGYVSVPLLGEVLARGRSLAQFSEEVNRGLGAVLTGVSAAVILKEKHPAVIFVVGEVNNPGRYSVSGPVSGLQALALAGGLTGTADRATLLVLRPQEDRIRTTQLDGQGLLRQENRTVLFLLQPGDTLLVPAEKMP